MLRKHYQWTANIGIEVKCVVALVKLMRRWAGAKHVWGFVGARCYTICRVHLKDV